jgi:hypothetical protein
MSGSDEWPSTPTGERCPACLEQGGALTLLTSMTRYYSCVRCHRSWHVMREFEAESKAAD